MLARQIEGDEVGAKRQRKMTRNENRESKCNDLFFPIPKFCGH